MKRVILRPLKLFNTLIFMNSVNHPHKTHNLLIGFQEYEPHKAEDVIVLTDLYNPANDHFTNALLSLINSSHFCDCSKSRKMQKGRNYAVMSSESAFFAMESAVNFIIYSLVLNKQSPIYIKENKSKSDKAMLRALTNRTKSLADKFEYISTKHDCCDFYDKWYEKIGHFEAWRNSVVHGLTYEHDILFEKKTEINNQTTYQSVITERKKTKGDAFLTKHFDTLKALDIHKLESFCKHDALKLFNIAESTIQFLTNHFGLNVHSWVNYNNKIYSYSTNDKYPAKIENATHIHRNRLYSLINDVFHEDELRQKTHNLKQSQRGNGFRKKPKQRRK